MRSFVFVIAMGIAVGFGSAAVAAQRGGSGAGGAGFACGGGVCTCTGDVDCNDMFGGGTCPGDSRDKCEIGADGVAHCTCYTAHAVKPGVKVLRPKLGTTKLAPVN